MHILYHATKEPIFGVEMMEELARHGYDVGAGTLYPMLHQMEEAGYLTSRTEVVAGKRRALPCHLPARPPSRRPRQSSENCSSRFSTMSRPGRRSDPTRPRGTGAGSNADHNSRRSASYAALAGAGQRAGRRLGHRLRQPRASVCLLRLCSETPPRILAARVKVLEELIPDQAHIMADVGDHFLRTCGSLAGPRTGHSPISISAKPSRTSAGPSAASRSARTIEVATSTWGTSSKPSKTASSRS